MTPPSGRSLLATGADGTWKARRRRCPRPRARGQAPKPRDVTLDTLLFGKKDTDLFICATQLQRLFILHTILYTKVASVTSEPPLAVPTRAPPPARRSHRKRNFVNCVSAAAGRAEAVWFLGDV